MGSFSIGMGAVPWVIMSEVSFNTSIISEIPNKNFKCKTMEQSKFNLMSKLNCLQIFPINVKGIGGSLVTLVNWFGSWAISYTFNFLMDWSSAGK